MRFPWPKRWRRTKKQETRRVAPRRPPREKSSGERRVEQLFAEGKNPEQIRDALIARHHGAELLPDGTGIWVSKGTQGPGFGYQTQAWMDAQEHVVVHWASLKKK